MKAWIVSDLHVNNSELSRHYLEIPEADICICAGDVPVSRNVDAICSEQHQPSNAGRNGLG